MSTSVTRTFLAAAVQPITNLGLILTRQRPSQALVPTKSLKVMSQQMLPDALQYQQILLADPMEAANISTKFASNLKLGSKSSIFQLVPLHGSARQMDWQEPNQLAQKEVMLLSGLSVFPI